MFENNGGLVCYNYNVNLTEIIDPICRLLIDIVKSQESKLLSHNLLDKVFCCDKVLKNIDLEDLEVDDFISELCRYLESEFIKTENAKEILVKSEILFLLKSQNLVFGIKKTEKEIKNTISKILSNYNPIDKLFELIKFDDLHVYKSQIGHIIHKAFYEKAVIIKSSKAIPSAPIYWTFLDSNLLKNISIDVEDVWINKKELINKFDITLENTENISEVFKQEQSIGIKIGNIFIPKMNLNEFINQVHYFEYNWRMFKYVYKNNDSQNIFNNYEILNLFKANSTEADLNKLLSYLNYNLYINSNHESHIGKYSNFFEEIQQLEALDYLKKYSFYVPKGNNKTEFSSVFGVYTKEKEGNSYNLLHWIDYEKNNKKNRFFRDNQCVEKDPSHIFILRPEISFYYISKYFEELLFSAIKSCENVELLTNFTLIKKGETTKYMEIDCLIKTKSKFIFIEAKTKLTKYYIEDTIAKFTKINKLVSEFNPKIMIEFVLIAAYSDETCESYKYFIDKSTKKSNNILRDGLNTKTFNFDVPLAEFKDLNMTCIAEPVFEELKKEIKNLCLI